MLHKSRFVFLLKNNFLWHSLLGKSVKVSDDLYRQLKENPAIEKTNNPEMLELIKSHFMTTEAQDNQLLLKTKNEISDDGFNNLFLIMTNRCNLACKYCFYQNTQHLQHTKMSFDTAQKALDLFVEKQNKNEQSQDWFSQITFYGGEPLINFDCIQKTTDYIQKLKSENKLSPKTQLVINTNGVLINQAVINWAKENHVQVQLSIDGNKNIHDKNRVFATGQGSYAKTIKGLNNLIKNDIDVLPLITVTNDNLPQLPKLISQLCKKYKLKHYGMNLLIDLGKQPISNYPKDAAKQMIECNHKTSALGASDDAIDALFKTIKNFSIVKQSCGISRKMTVFPDGKILACQAISDCDRAVIGSVSTGLSRLNNIRYWKNYSRFNHEKCLKCKYIAFCGAGCVASAWFRHQKFETIDLHYCKWLKNIMKKYFNPRNYLEEKSDVNCNRFN
ncbi:MAG: radical SAM protein [Alphaproteobacteria bacterium]|nr:radical SAM protein [Alphaproteobacteria bacterium]